MGRQINILLLVLLSIWLFKPHDVYAVDKEEAQRQAIFNQSGLQIPRFVSLRSNKVFVRTGPALRYPIKWIFTKENLPVEIIQEFDTWRKVRDLSGEEGWIHQSLLQGKRYGIINAEKPVFLQRKPVTDSRPVAMLEPRVIIALESCSGAWCNVEANGYEGWIEKKLFWGVYETEELN